jgi:Domain of unknown function (DUF4224)
MRRSTILVRALFAEILACHAIFPNYTEMSRAHKPSPPRIPAASPVHSSINRPFPSPLDASKSGGRSRAIPPCMRGEPIRTLSKSTWRWSSDRRSASPNARETPASELAGAAMKSLAILSDLIPTSVASPTAGSVALFLDSNALYELTRRRRSDAQVRMLRAMGIEHRIRADGSVAVLRAHIERLFGAGPPSHSQEHNAEPNWSAI